MGFDVIEEMPRLNIRNLLQASTEESPHLPPLLEQEHERPSHFPPFAVETFSTQLIWLSFFFGILYLFVARVAAPRMGGPINRRAAQIEGDHNAAQKAYEQQKQLTETLEAALNDSRTQAQKMLFETHEAIDAENVERRKHYDQDMQKQLKISESHVHTLKENILKDITTSSAETASLIVQRLTGVTPTEAQIKRVASSAKKKSSS
jgi:F-type H+-transporting ATPase subunit b